MYHVTVEFRITMQFEANSQLSFNWKDKKEEVFCYVLGQILQRFLCRVDSYFALKKQCHPKHFKGLLHCFSTFSRNFPNRQVFMREADC